MCATEANSPPWHVVHLLLIGLTTFSDPRHQDPTGVEAYSEAVLSVLAVAPVLFIQLKLGTVVRKNVYGLFERYFPLLRGVAVALVYQMFVDGSMTSMTPVHHICAAFASVTGERQTMVRCDNPWNTNFCSPGPSHLAGSDVLPGAVYEYLTYRFYEHNFDASPGDLGGFVSGFPTFPLVLLVTWLIVFSIVSMGPRVFAWVVSLLGGLSVVMMMGVLVYGWAIVAKTGVAVTFPGYALPYHSDSGADLSSYRVWRQGVWILARLSCLWAGVLPTMGKFTRSGRLICIMAVIFIILELVILRHLQKLTLKPYELLANVTKEMGYNSVNHVLNAFVYSQTNPAASFFFFLANYLHLTCKCALYLLVIVDNCLECFDWLLKRRGWRKRVVWVITTASFSVFMMLLGLPHLTQGFSYFNNAMIVATANLLYVTWFFFGFGITSIYIQQKTSTVGRLVFGIWTCFATVMWVITGFIDQFTFHTWMSRHLPKWTELFWVVSVASVVWIYLGIGFFILQSLWKLRNGKLYRTFGETSENVAMSERRRSRGDSQTRGVGLTETQGLDGERQTGGVGLTETQ